MRAKRIGKRGSRVFLYCIIGLCGCLCSLTVFGLWRLGGWLKAYDQSRPEFAVGQVTAQLAQEDWQPLVAYLAPPLSEFEEMGQLRRYFLEKGMDFTAVEYRRIADNRYELFCMGERLATLSIVRKEGQESGGFAIYTPEKLHFSLSAPREYTATVPQGAVLTVNGRQVPEQQFLVQEGARYGSVVCPDRLRLRMQGLYFEPELSAQLGEKPLIIVKNGKNAVAKLLPDERQIALLSSFAVEGAQKYANFISNDAKFEDIRPLLMTGTALYTHLSQFYNGWYIEHDSFDFRKMQLSDWEQLGGEVFSCGITFDYIVKKGWREYAYPSSYRMVLLHRQGEQPLLVDLQVV